MRIRLEGTRTEVIDALLHLRLHFTVIAASRLYPARAEPCYWRIYLTTTPRERR